MNAPMQERLLRVLVVIVNYRCAELTIDCLRSLQSQRSAIPNLQVKVVENASGDRSEAAIADAITANGWWEWVSLLPLSENRGFAAGNNAAIAGALSGPNPPDYFLLLNPDTLVHDGAISALVDFLEGHRDVGIAGSRLEHAIGKPQRSAFRFPGIASELENGLRLGLVSSLLRNSIVAPPPPSGECRTDWVAGASMMIRREVFESIGLMDEEYFLYYEEVDFCRRAAIAGWSCWYVPASRVIHLVGQSSGVTDSARRGQRRPAYWFASRGRYFRKHLGRFKTMLADAAWAGGYAMWRVRRLAQRKAAGEPAYLLRDFLRHALGLAGEPARRSDSAITDMAEARRAGSPAKPIKPAEMRGEQNLNPADISLFKLLREDLATHDNRILEQGFWALAVHRLGNARMSIRLTVLRWPISVLYRLAEKFVEWTCGITLPYTVRVGRRVRIWHHGGMILHARQIGDDVHIRQNTTFGIARRDDHYALPTIGDRADIGCGVCVLGPIHIGNDATIGANSVVLKDVPPGAVAVGAPARVVRQEHREQLARAA
jgi:N-acetylglucosaminyl-diphospho-decaprenol L-rhamnosyltransferase